MAGAAPADDLALFHAAPGWADSLPQAALAHVMRLLPADACARAACVCRSWRDAAADPAQLAALWFDDSSVGKLNDKALARLCVRAGAALRELRLESPACHRVTATGVIAALNSGGCAGVQRLTFPTRDRVISNDLNSAGVNAEQAQQLAAACPALEHAACLVRCARPEDVATACSLLSGPLALVVRWQGDTARAAMRLPAQMAELLIFDCDVDAAAVAASCEALRTNTTLKTLKLWGVLLGEAGGAALGEALRTNTTLTTLEVSSYGIRDNAICDAGAAAVANALRTNATLTSLCLFANNIGDTGAAALAEALRANATLTKLDLSYNSVGDVGATALGDVLRTNTTLTTLDLNDNEFGDAGAAVLGEAVRMNTTLTMLNFG